MRETGDMSDGNYDAIVVGAGQGGIPLAVNLADGGWRVALVERKYLGGTCVNYGCTPTKAMVASARAAHVARSSGELGVEVSGVSVDFPRVVARKNEIVTSFREGLRGRVDRENLELVRGEARFTDPDAVAVAGVDGERILRSDRIVVNVGARPFVPPIPGLEEVPWVDSTGVMELAELPERLLVVGGGYVGCEFAQMFSRFGSDVTVFQRSDRLLPREDPDIAGPVEEAFRDEGLRVLTGAGVTRAETLDDGSIRVHAERDGEVLTVDGDDLLVATGRRPNTEDLGLEDAGVQVDGKGHVPTDDQFRTGVDGIWAIGDVNGKAPFTNVSYRDFQILYENWVNDADLSAADRHVTHAVFVDPPVAGVGLNEREADERGADYRVASTPMTHVARAIETGETRGLMKVLVDPDSRRILGASMVGLSADEVMHVFTAVMDAGAPYDALERGVYAHPAVAEALPVLVRKIEGGYA